MKVSEEFPQYSSYVLYMAFDNFGVGSIEIDRTDNFVGKATIGVPYGDGKAGRHNVCFSPGTGVLKCLVYTIDALPKPKTSPKPTPRPTPKPTALPLVNPGPSPFPVTSAAASSIPSTQEQAASPTPVIALADGGESSPFPSFTPDLRAGPPAAGAVPSVTLAFAIGAILALAMLGGLFSILRRP